MKLLSWSGEVQCGRDGGMVAEDSDRQTVLKKVQLSRVMKKSKVSPNKMYLIIMQNTVASDLICYKCKP